MSVDPSSVLHSGLQVVVMLALIRVLWLSGKAPAEARSPRNRLRPVPGMVMFLLTVLFAGALLHQATWQLFGIMRPSFLSFMQQYDRRQFNPAHRLRRGTILDRNGVRLAYSELRDDGRVHRVYPLGATFSHLVGYSHSRFGMAGLEQAANLFLNGTKPVNFDEWEVWSRELIRQQRDPGGEDIVLTLDARLQKVAADLLRNKRGAAVIMRCDDGAVLALASAPAFDPNTLSAASFDADPKVAPLLNRATRGLYPPGSTYKIAVAALALESGFTGTLDCPAEGYAPLPNHPPIRDHDYYQAIQAGRSWPGHGHIDLTTALAVSSNVFFAKLGVRLGPDLFARNAARFRVGDAIVLYNDGWGDFQSAAGEIPPRRKLDPYALAQMSIGQGPILATPLHMALIAAATGNGGVGMQPRIDFAAQPRALGRMLNPQVAATLLTQMRRVVTDGTARSYRFFEPAIAAKTGTAENPHGPPHAWFVGVAPYPAPTIAFAVLIENGGYGGTAAAPVAVGLVRKADELGLTRARQ